MYFKLKFRSLYKRRHGGCFRHLGITWCRTPLTGPDDPRSSTLTLIPQRPSPKPAVQAQPQLVPTHPVVSASLAPLVPVLALTTIPLSVHPAHPIILVPTILLTLPLRLVDYHMEPLIATSPTACKQLVWKSLLIFINNFWILQLKSLNETLFIFRLNFINVKNLI